MYDYFIAPFEYGFLNRALVACFALSLGCGPMGVLLLLRRMSLMGDALSHAVLPGAAIGFLLMGLSLPAMSAGGFAAGLVVALASGFISRVTHLREDASLAGFYLLSLAIGVLIVSTSGNNVDLMHVLFGTVLAVDNMSLFLVAGIATFTLILISIVYRPLMFECFDPFFLKSVGSRGGPYHFIFLILVVLNLVAGFQALGTLMALGLMMLPAIAAKFWAQRFVPLACFAILFAFMSGYFGLLMSYHYKLPSGPSIIIVAGAFYLISMVFGPHGSIYEYLFGTVARKNA